MLLWNHAGADPIKAAEVLIKLEAREARLLGLDMPTKVAVTDCPQLAPMGFAAIKGLPENQQFDDFGRSQFFIGRA